MGRGAWQATVHGVTKNRTRLKQLSTAHMCVCIYVCVCVYMCVCVYIYVCIYIYILFQILLHYYKILNVVPSTMVLVVQLCYIY